MGAAKIQIKNVLEYSWAYQQWQDRGRNEGERVPIGGNAEVRGPDPWPGPNVKQQTLLAPKIRLRLRPKSKSKIYCPLGPGRHRPKDPHLLRKMAVRTPPGPPGGGGAKNKITNILKHCWEEGRAFILNII